MDRITWLDASRGLAVVLLVLMHYCGALESRQFISKDTLDVLYGLLRLATPFFMFTFGFAFCITASKKLATSSLKSYYLGSVLKRMWYIFLGREVIVIILALYHPETMDDLWKILTFQQFARGGEIFIFYFFAFMIAPLNVVFLQKVKLPVYIAFWLIIYSVAFYIGDNFVDRGSNNALRFLFYDIYAFFPFLLVVAIAMLIGKLFVESKDRDRFIKYGLAIGVLLFISGLVYLSVLSEDVWLSLSNAEFKSPPHPGYMMFYLGEVFIVVGLVALAMPKLPRLFNDVLSLLGRNTLVSYVVHYLFFFSVPTAALFGGGALFEVTFFAIFICLGYFGIKLWDTHKRKKKASAASNA